MTDEEFARVVDLGHELAGIEFKPPGPRSDRNLFIWVAKAALGMANHRDGGLIVIGIDETTGRPNPAGLTSEQLATWAYDDVADGLTACSDPKISVEVETRSYHGRHFIVIRIHEFEEIPVLAKKDLIANERQVVRKGACYVRSLSKPETSEIPSQDEMRDLLDLAIQKGVRKFVQRAVAAGLIGVPVGTSTPEADAKFNAQLKDLR